MLRPENLDDTIEEETDSDNGKDNEVSTNVGARPSSMYGRTNYGENSDFGQSVAVSEKVREYRRKLKIREKQLNKAFTIIRKQQLTNNVIFKSIIFKFK